MGQQQLLHLSQQLAHLPHRHVPADSDARHQALLDKGAQTQVDARHQALLRHGAEGAAVYVTSAPVPSSDGTDWASIGLGTGAGFAVLVLGAGTALVGRRKLASA